jgi:hypothetical protein
VPDGQIAHACHAQIARRANLPQPDGIAVTPKSAADFAASRPHKRGVSRSSRTLGAGCDGRFSFARRATLLRTGEVVWSWRPDAGVKLAEGIPQATVAKSPVTGESTKETVKTIAQGRPGQSGEPVVTTLVCFIYFAREAAGATGTRLSLRPLSFEGHCLAKLGRVAPRECGFVFEIRKPSLRGAKRRSNPFFFAA